MFKHIIENKLGLTTADKNYRKSYFVLSTLVILVFTLSFFVYLNIFVTTLYGVAILDGAGLLASYFCWQALIKRKDIELAATILISIIFVLTLLFIMDQNHNDYAFVYGVILPIISIYLKGIRIGLLYCLVYFGILLSIAFLGIDSWKPVGFTTVSFINLTAVYLIVALLIFYYELSRSEAFEKLEKLSTTDMLTGLFNRRHIDLKMHEVYILSQRYETPFSVILLDIDDFKKINDSYGHLEGDKVLKKISQILSTNSRESDIVGRWGGEEFLIICPNTNLYSARHVAEKMRQVIEIESFGIDFCVTASFGISEYKSAQACESMILMVDRALYKAKEEGKNKIVVVEN